LAPKAIAFPVFLDCLGSESDRFPSFPGLLGSESDRFPSFELLPLALETVSTYLLSTSLQQYFGQFLIAYGRIRVSRLQGKFATNGKSMVSEYELKTVRTIVTEKWYNWRGILPLSQCTDSEKSH
jgi:hypothetical protein